MYAYLFTVAGLILFFEGIPYLATPHQLKKWLEWVVSTRTPHLRLLGAGLMVVGLAMVYWGRNHGG